MIRKLQKIRNSVFETNSSSTHAIVIATGILSKSLPETLTFEKGEFGWERNVLTSPEEKASYLYTAIHEVNNEAGTNNDLSKLKNLLGEVGVTAKFMKSIFSDYGYIDHGCELTYFVDEILSNRDTLLKYLFSSQSVVVTHNDNSDISLQEILKDMSINYPHKIYYKSN